MDWTKNLILYCQANQAGNCPNCGSIRIEVTEHIYEQRKSLTLCCKDCGKWTHFDGFNKNDK